MNQVSHAWDTRTTYPNSRILVVIISNMVHDAHKTSYVIDAKEFARRHLPAV